MNKYFADFETTTSRTEYYKNTNSVTVWLWRIVNNEGFAQTGTDLSDFIDVCFTLPEPLIYFHYLTFDGDFITKYLVKHRGFKIVNGAEIQPNQMRVFRQSGKIYSITLNYKNNLINFRCSLLLLSSPIKELGKSLGISKYDDTYNDSFYDVEPTPFNEIPQNYIDYIERDVTIQQQSYNALQELLFDMYGIDLEDHLTITSCVTSILHQILKKYQKPKFSNKNVFETAIHDIEPNTMLMRGGLTQFDPRYLGKENKLNELIFIDINSAYPYQMSKELPHGRILDNPPKDYNYCAFMKIRVKSIKPLPETKYISMFPNIPQKKALANVFNLGKMSYSKCEVPLRYINNYDGDPFEMWIYENELEQFKKMYKLKYKVLEKKYMCLSDYFSEFPKRFYPLKKQFKNENKPAFEKMVKILLNSAFGALCKRVEYDSYLYTLNGDEKVIDDRYSYTKKAENSTYNIGKYKCCTYSKDDHATPTINARFVGAWIASQNRVRLMSTIMSISPTKWVYCDTDSLVFNSLDEEELARLHKKVGKELGQWSIEEQRKDVFFSLYGAKKYRVRDMESVLKEKFAGLDKGSFIWEMINEDSVYIEDATLQMKRVEDGILLIPTSKVLQKGHL